ncbi:MAG: hypothetical protein IT267_06595 [Saprospiraceae bacterium]|nr:hypothetical protein [Saprospiraceae bacterium]
MKKAFITNLLFLILINLLIKPFYLFGIERQVQFIVGDAEYGYYYNLFNFTLILQFINDFGIQNYSNRTISQENKDPGTKSRELLQFKLFLSFIYLIFTLIVARIWYGPSLDFGFVLHLCINQILISLIFFLRSNIAGLGLYFIDSLFSILDRLLLILLMSVLIYLPFFKEYLNVQSFVNIQTYSLITCSMAAFLVLSKHKLKYNFQIIKFNELKSIFRFCLPFAMIYLTTALFSKADTLWIENILDNGKQEAGIYAKCFRLYDAFTILSLSFAGLLLGMFSKLYNQKNELHELLVNSMKYLFILSVGIGIAGYFYAEDINRLLNRSNDIVQIKLISYLCLAFIPGSLNYILGAYYQANHLENKLLKSYTLCAVLSIVLNYCYLPIYGILASSVITIIIQSLLLVISLIPMYSIFREQSGTIFKFFGFSIELFVIFWIFNRFIEWNYILEIIGISILSIIRLIMLSIINIDSIRILFNQFKGKL